MSSISGVSSGSNSSPGGRSYISRSLFGALSNRSPPPLEFLYVATNDGSTKRYTLWECIKSHLHGTHTEDQFPNTLATYVDYTTEALRTCGIHHWSDMRLLSQGNTTLAQAYQRAILRDHCIPRISQALGMCPQDTVISHFVMYAMCIEFSTKLIEYALTLGDLVQYSSNQEHPLPLANPSFDLSKGMQLLEPRHRQSQGNVHQGRAGHANAC